MSEKPKVKASVLAIVGMTPFLLVLAWGTAAATCGQEPQQMFALGAPFADNAVLQREMTLPVWGWSKPGAKVTVQFADQRQTATTNEQGKWLVELKPLQASFQPRELAIGDDQGNRRVIKNVLVGEVWLASGQSNMQWKVAKSSSSLLKVEPQADGVTPIREFEVTSVVAMLHPIEKATGEWKNGNYGDYSAIAFAFAHRLYEELNVPIGILNCSFSQTAIQAWVPREGFRDGKDDYTHAIHQRILATDPSTSEHKAAWSSFYQKIENTLIQNEQRISQGLPARAISTKTPGNMSGNRDASWLFNGRLSPVVPFAVRGAIWNQGYANMGEGLPYYSNLHSLVRGWRMVWNRPELPVYFHQFYCPSQKGEWNNSPSIGGVADMRLGTWLARDIAHVGMASQIDISGSIHYWNKAVPGQRLAQHALKNQYGKHVVADGPMFKSYQVEGDKLIVDFDFADEGLVVAETRSNTDRANKEATGFADPKVIEKGDDQVKLFYLADEHRMWHAANMKIAGSQVILTSPKVKSPRGVSYGAGGVGFQPNLYNRALLPMTPFIYFDHKLVTNESWPDEKLQVAGQVTDPGTVGKLYEWRKMPLLSTQFRDSAVLQAGMPITFWGSALHDYGHPAEGDAVIKFRFAGIEKTIPVTDDSPYIFELGPGESRAAIGKEWRVTLPPMKASAEPKTLKVSFWIDGELAHERVCKNIVVGDVWFVAAPQLKFDLPATKPSGQVVRVMSRKAKRSTSPSPSRYSVCVSRTPLNRFACTWEEAGTDTVGEIIGHHLAARTSRPVGVVFMQNTVPKEGTNPKIKSWIPVEGLRNAPSLAADYQDLAAVVPGNRHYNDNVRRYVAAWKAYWHQYIPQMIKNKEVPDGLAWGSYPTLASSVTSDASQTYNVLVHPFSQCGFSGILFLTSPEMVSDDQGAKFGEQLSALANGWKERFAGEDQHFYYTVPSKTLSPKITLPADIDGEQTPIKVDSWTDLERVIETVVQ